MNRSWIVALGALLWMGPNQMWGGEPRQMQLQWSELGPRIADRKVALVLPDGTHLEGKVRGVEPDGLRLRISKTSDRKAQPKGDGVIPRQSVSVLRVTEYRKLWRVLATTGAIAAAAGVVLANKPDVYEGPLVAIIPAVVAGGMAGVGVAGYYTGKALDKKVTEIRIVREP
jgi:hypothetical protein